jgi:phosphodiesterase/alkaline phosphatase D-like protein
MLSFGSCNRQTKPQEYWETIGSLRPTHFLWLGDAVYSKGRTIEKLEAAYQNQTNNQHYSNFVRSVTVDGVWDDHDYGVNDAGKHAPFQPDRTRLYSQFLQYGAGDTPVNYDHDGIYHSFITDLNGAKVKVIFLDTRSFRDDHWVRSLGELPIKGSALVASSIRGAYSTLGFARQYGGEMLGEAQWAWLEETLQASEQEEVVANVVVSSVQVLTTNPVFESWGHFPVEKKRLFDLISRLDPRGLVFLSGDVHLAEISQASYSRADGSSGQWMEVTSSGLTHTCAEGYTGFLCPVMMALFSQHRRAGTSLYLGRNFGTMEVQPQPVDGFNITFSVRSVADATTVLSHSLVTSASNRPASPIVSVSYPDFMQLPPAVSVSAMVLLLWLVSKVFTRRDGSRQRSEKKSS